MLVFILRINKKTGIYWKTCNMTIMSLNAENMILSSTFIVFVLQNVRESGFIFDHKPFTARLENSGHDVRPTSNIAHSVANLQPPPRFNLDPSTRPYAKVATRSVHAHFHRVLFSPILRPFRSCGRHRDSESWSRARGAVRPRAIRRIAAQLRIMYAARYSFFTTRFGAGTAG